MANAMLRPEKATEISFRSAALLPSKCYYYFIPDEKFCLGGKPVLRIRKGLSLLKSLLSDGAAPRIPNELGSVKRLPLLVGLCKGG